MIGDRYWSTGIRQAGLTTIDAECQARTMRRAREAADRDRRWRNDVIVYAVLGVLFPPLAIAAIWHLPEAQRWLSESRRRVALLERDQDAWRLGWTEMGQR